MPPVSRNLHSSSSISLECLSKLTHNRKENSNWRRERKRERDKEWEREEERVGEIYSYPHMYMYIHTLSFSNNDLHTLQYKLYVK